MIRSASSVHLINMHQPIYAYASTNTRWEENCHLHIKVACYASMLGLQKGFNNCYCQLFELNPDYTHIWDYINLELLHDISLQNTQISITLHSYVIKFAAVSNIIEWVSCQKSLSCLGIWLSDAEAMADISRFVQNKAIQRVYNIWAGYSMIYVNRKATICQQKNFDSVNGNGSGKI